MSNALIESSNPEILYQINNSGTDWERVISAMTDVVHGERGTARGIGINSRYKIAGKSGTAQVFSLAKDEEYEEDKIAEELHDHALFVSFAPADDPKIAIAIIIENGGGGSANAAPIARLLFDDYLQQLEITKEQLVYETTDSL